MAFPVDKFVQESNAIEGIHRRPALDEISEAERFMALGDISIVDLERFVSVYQPNAILRDQPGLNVRVGSHVAPTGGRDIVFRLTRIIGLANAGEVTPYDNHHSYETLHPFTDGNGRSGRILFAWMMERQGNRALHYRGFLHEWYYQSLEARR